MMMGSETEFGILGGWKLGKADSIQKSVSQSQPFLRALKEGIFLANGSRVYVDLEKQNEYATPETTSPSELVRYELSGRQLMSECAAAVNHTLLCSNVDPETGSTWGTHENYQCTGHFNQTHLAKLYPHLVSRIIYTGSGGICSDHPGVRTVLSARACKIRAPYSAQGYACKSLVFSKPELYCPGDRLHVFCGESLLSHRANYLKYATTALVVYCLDAGLDIGPGPFAMSPIRVLRNINRDHSIISRYKTLQGKLLTALEIQETYLDDISSHLNILPSWACEACERWRDMLTRLRDNDPSLSRQLDWMIYRTAVMELADEFGFDEDKLTWMNRAVLPTTHKKASNPEIEHFQSFRAAANELYVRFHILGGDSIFEKLDKEGMLEEHHLPEITTASVATGVCQAPPGRAASRSTLILKYNGLEHFYVSWDRLLDKTHYKDMAILDDPALQGDEPWQERKPRSTNCDGFFEYANMRQSALNYIQEGLFDKALELYQRLLAVDFESAGTHSHIARVFLLTDNWDAASKELDLAWKVRGTAAKYVIPRILFMKALVALIFGNDPIEHLSEIKGCLKDSRAHLDWTIKPVLDHLTPHMTPSALDLMRVLAQVLCNRDALPSLEAMPDWQVISSIELAEPPPVQSEDNPEPEMENFSFGKIVSASATEIIVKEYDFSSDAEIETTYIATPETEFGNIQKLSDLKPGDAVVLDYTITNGHRRMVTIVCEVDQPETPMLNLFDDVPF